MGQDEVEQILPGWQVASQAAAPELPRDPAVGKQLSQLRVGVDHQDSCTGHVGDPGAQVLRQGQAPIKRGCESGKLTPPARADRGQSTASRPQRN